KMHEAKRTKPVVDRYDDDVAMQREVRAVVPRRVARTPNKCAAMDPKHHRTTRVVACWCPDVEIQTVFAARRLRAAHHRGHRELGLCRLRRELGGVTHA